MSALSPPLSPILPKINTRHAIIIPFILTSEEDLTEEKINNHIASALQYNPELHIERRITITEKDYTPTGISKYKFVCAMEIFKPQGIFVTHYKNEKNNYFENPKTYVAALTNAIKSNLDLNSNINITLQGPTTTSNPIPDLKK